MATESTLGTIHIFPSKTSYTSNSSSITTSDICFVPIIDEVIETYVNGTTWYRKFSSGWVEQGGQVTCSSFGQSITYQVAFADTNYGVYTCGGSVNNSTGIGNIVFYNRTATGAKMSSADDASFNVGVIIWMACGMGA
jgi:hypothetical protein